MDYESTLFGDLGGLCKFPARNMEQLRFNQETLTALAQDRLQLSEERLLIGHLMNHVEGQDKIDRVRDIDLSLITLDGSDPAFELRPMDLGVEFLEHALLEIGRNDFAAYADLFRHFNGEVPGATANVENCHSWLDERANKFRRILQPPPDFVVKRRGTLNWADSISLLVDGSSLDGVSLC